MSFAEPSCDNFVGKDLICLPTYGSGWFRSDLEQAADFDIIACAGHFTLCLEGFFYYGARRNGIYGLVVQPGHIFDGLSVEGTIMQYGEFGFEESLCHRIDLEIGPVFPSKRGMAMTQGSPRYHGSSIVADQLATLEKDPRISGILSSYQNLRQSNE